MRLIIFKTDRLKSVGIFTVAITSGSFVILYHCLFKIIQGIHAQVQFINNNVPDAYASGDINRTFDKLLSDIQALQF